MSVTSWLSRPSLLRTLFSQVRLAWRLLRDPGVPSVLKAVPFAAALYLVSPLDVVPDIFPIVGQLDDLGVLTLALELFVKWCPPAAVSFHKAAMGQRRAYSPMPGDGDVIDAEFRRESTIR